MLGVLPFVEDPDISQNVAPTLPQHLPPWYQVWGIQEMFIKKDFNLKIFLSGHCWDGPNSCKAQSTQIISQTYVKRSRFKPKNIIFQYILFHPCLNDIPPKYLSHVNEQKWDYCASLQLGTQYSVKIGKTSHPIVLFSVMVYQKSGSSAF